MADREQELLEDIAYQEAEGPSDTYESDADAWERMGPGEGGPGGEDGWSAATADPGDGYEGDGLYAGDAYEGEGLEGEGLEGEGYEGEGYEGDGYEGDGLEGDSLDALMTSALGAEDEDEFWKGAVRFAKKAASTVGKAARFAKPFLSAIPLPQAQAAAQVAGLLGKLRAEGASTEDALEAVAELAVRDRRALPVVAGLAARSMVKNRGGQMSVQQRRQAIQAASRAVRTLVAQGGPQAVRALPKIARSVKRVTASKGTPVAMRSRVLQRTVAKVAGRPQLMRRLALPSARAQQLVQGLAGVGGRTLRVRGPATISIRYG